MKPALLLALAAIPAILPVLFAENLRSQEPPVETGQTVAKECAGSKDARLARAVTLDDYHPWTPVTDLAAWKARSRRVREQILVSAGLWPPPPAVPLEPVIHGKIDRDAYTVEKVYFQSWTGFWVTGNLYRPKAPASGPRPGVLCPHGHWANGRFYENSDDGVKREMEVGAEKTPEGARYPLQARCAMLARMGCVVFHYDMVGMADSKQLRHGAGFGDAEAELRLQSAFGVQLWNSIRSLDFLLSLPEVDSKRIGVTGASGGGTQTFFLSAVDDRPAAAFPAVMVSTAMQGGCVCENATLLRVGTGNIEFAALTAPRPLGMTGADDWTKEIETKGLPELKALYAALGVPDRVDAKCHPHFEHNYNQVSRERMYSWFSRYLRLGWPEPVEEKPFVPVPPKDLSVLDDAHRVPAGAVDTAGLRKAWADASDRQIQAMRPKDAPTLEEFRRVVGPALRAIVADELPDGAAVEARKVSEDRIDGVRRESILLGRRGSGEEVPATWLTSDSWDGTVVVAVADDASRARLGSGAAERVPPEAAAVVAKGAAVLAPEVFLTGRLVPEGKEPKPPVDPQRHGSYVGYTFGYNRTPLANRVHDVLTAVAYARSLPGVKSVRLLGLGEGGLWCLLASALCGGAVERIVAERPSFDFQEVQDVNDLRLLPGGVKYGGWGAFAALCAPGDLRILGEGELPEVLPAAYRAVGAGDRLRRPGKVDGAGIVAALLE